jgi:hypothetical protein
MTKEQVLQIRLSEDEKRFPPARENILGLTDKLSNCFKILPRQLPMTNLGIFWER